MKLALTLEVDSVNMRVLNMGRIIIDVDGIDPTELDNKVAESGYSLRVVDAPEQQTTDSPPSFAALTDIRSLQYRAYHGKGQRLAVLTATSDEWSWRIRVDSFYRYRLSVTY